MELSQLTKDIDPGALFDEARKLERSGSTRGALQRYHYVATNWPNSIEGAAARLECERVTGRKWADIPPPSPMDDPEGDDSSASPPLPEGGLSRDTATTPPPPPLGSLSGDSSAIHSGVQVDFDPDYGAGIATARFTEFCGWILIVILPFFAAFAISSGAFGGNAGAGLIVVVGVACVGLVIIVLAQASRALLETANTNREILAVIKALSRGQTSQG